MFEVGLFLLFSAFISCSSIISLQDHEIDGHLVITFNKDYKDQCGFDHNIISTDADAKIHIGTQFTDSFIISRSDTDNLRVDPYFLAAYEIVNRNSGLPVAYLEIKRNSDDECALFNWERVSGLATPLEDCILLSNDDHALDGILKKNDHSTWWYGGAETFTNYYATKSFHGENFTMQPFISSDIFASTDNLGGVLQAFWLNSNGWSISGEKQQSLLWASYNINETSNPASAGALCFRSENISSKPYEYQELNYKLCRDKNIQSSWEKRVRNEITFENQSPSITMIKNPIWSTWAEFKKFVNQSLVLEYANTIIDNNYPYSVLEIDDHWSSTYGDFTFDTQKFPHAQKMINILHHLNFSVMLWITPFCDTNAAVYQEGIKNHYWVMQVDPQDSNNTIPALIKWWDNNSTGSAVLDVTNPQARNWFLKRLKTLKQEMKIDGFKLDAGETVYIPSLQDPSILYYNKSLLGNGAQPLMYTNLYSDLANQLGEFTEVRSAWHNQPAHNFVRVMDLDSTWSHSNGIKSVIPRVLLFSTLGYRYALPDMIGGNGYGPRGDLLYRGAPSAELYIRWMQMNVLLPMQMSIPPWRYATDSLYSELLVAVDRVFELRRHLLPVLANATIQAMDTGIPLAMPMWYAAPCDSRAYTVEDQYLIANQTIIAPILDEGQQSRAVYLPPGQWVACEVYFNLLIGIIPLRRYPYLRVEFIEGSQIINITNIGLTSYTPCFIRYNNGIQV